MEGAMEGLPPERESKRATERDSRQKERERERIKATEEKGE